MLPNNSKSRYEQTYNSYRDWCVAKKVQNVGSESVLLTYFSELSKNKKPSTLWAIYSMLRATININDKVDIAEFNKLGAFLKKQNVGYKPKKSSVFTRQEIDTFLKNAPVDYLPHKVALIIGICGPCRSDELFNMKTSYVDFYDSKIIIQIPDAKTYLHPRVFIITDNKWTDIIKQYMALHKKVVIANERFFMQLRNGRITKQPFGHNAIGQIPKKIATFLKLKNKDTFTGHCFRRTAAALLVDREEKETSLASCSPTSSNEYNNSSEEVKYDVLAINNNNSNISNSYKRPRVAEEAVPKTVPIKPIEFVSVAATSSTNITPEIPEDIKDISFFLKLYVKQETLCLTEHWGIFPGENNNMKHILFSQMTVKNNTPTMEKQIILYSNLEIKFFFGTNQINHVTTSVISKEDLEKSINYFSEVNLPQMYEDVNVTNHVDHIDIKNEVIF